MLLCERCGSKTQVKEVGVFVRVRNRAERAWYDDERPGMKSVLFDDQAVGGDFCEECIGHLRESVKRAMQPSMNIATVTLEEEA